MKVALIFGIMLLLASCDRNSRKQEQPTPDRHVSYPDHFDQAWVMSSKWFGYMGVAIAISGDQYFYWMYSDIPVDADFPYTGTFRIEDGVLILESPSAHDKNTSGDEVPRLWLYSDRWKIIPGKLSVALHSSTDNPNDVARTLIPDFQFDPYQPFKNQQMLKPRLSFDD